MLENVRIVLVETSHTGNMGSTARAMKTMGLTNLYLVNPKVEPDSQAIALAAGASDVIGQAKIVASLDEAIGDCGLVIGTSARSRTLQWPLIEPRECGQRIASESRHHPVALVFGRERVGLTNEELQKCNYHVTIPANPEYSSLNLAMAVQLLAYEIRMNFLEQTRASEADYTAQESPYPLSGDLERFYQHLEQVLTDVNFIRTETPSAVMSKLRRMYTRARPEAAELNILRGMLTAVQKNKRKQDNNPE
ncbi:MAG: tRNA (cytosine(32)/uridine(32)-2'-O)-methyltransferase TrmJ [Plesiomonas sp.]|uniref:tRNA (cytosine(32)/uridine(32)-2'-O)-methyltransferase TrmJ n=1 Tax=Plesiomonas sp. TaxID=2486279 RepID=UPI003F4114DD